MIFVVSAILVARRAPGSYFLHGFLVGLTNWIWVAAVHVILRDAYVARHAKEVAAMQAMPMPDLGRQVMLIVGPIIQAARASDIPIPGLSGVVIGMLSWISSKIVSKRRPSLAATHP